MSASFANHFELQPNEVHCWCADLDVPPETFAWLYTTLSADERERSGRFEFERDQRQYIAAHGVLRDVLGSYLHIEPESIGFFYGSAGKPSLGDGFDKRLKFNLSHSA